MGKTTELRTKLKERFFPIIEAKGFAMDMREGPQTITFRKVTNGNICVFDIQWDKYGGSKFAVNFAMGALGDIVSYEGPVEPGDAFVYHFKDKGRLLSGRQFQWCQVDRQWFREDLNLTEKLLRKKKRSPDDVVDDLLEAFPDVEAFFEGKECRERCVLL